MANKTVSFEIKRQASPDAPAVWESFEIEWRPGMNVISAMMEIAGNPVTADGHSTTPITYDSNCLEEICGSCAMRINGNARMACSALIDNLEQPIRVEPLSKFPLVRDLQVDRSVLFENLKAVKAWIPIDGTYDLGAGPRVLPQEQEASYPLSNCISCTCCMEVCPQFNEDTNFVGAATIAQVKLFNNHPTGKVLKEERLRALAGDGGIQECGFAQNCVEVCPKSIPLTNTISEVSCDVRIYSDRFSPKKSFTARQSRISARCLPRRPGRRGCRPRWDRESRPESLLDSFRRPGSQEHHRR
jgi:succinate dehydrogenase / fumarate reductase iron-sulfur subunit